MLVKKQILGFDEVGRGCLAGPVVVAGVLAGKVKIPEKIIIRDSKKMTKLQKNKAAKWIKKNFIYGIGEVAPVQIDRLGIMEAVKQAAQKARGQLEQKQKIEHQKTQIINDGLQSWFPDGECLKEGDNKILAISMASIVAKVYRDNLVIKLASQYPDWGFEQHVGYGTAHHRAMIGKHGLILNLHRTSFCQKIVRI